jgi:hypothetical protein
MNDNHRPSQDQYVWKVRWARPHRKDSQVKHFSHERTAREFAEDKKRVGTLLLFARYQVKDVYFDAEG